VKAGARLTDISASLVLHPRSLLGWLRTGDPIRDSSAESDAS
jgi:hypothetical protein